MDQSANLIVSGGTDRISDSAFNFMALALVFAAYFMVFFLISGDGLLQAAAYSLRNLAALAIISTGAQAVIKGQIIGRSWQRQLAGNIIVGSVFTLVLYWLLMVLIGLSEGDSFTEFVVKAFFPTNAVAWQILQGLTLYALLACLTYMRFQPALSDLMIADYGAEKDNAKNYIPSRYFIKLGEDIVPVEVSQIVSIRGADDYAEVATLQRRHLVRMTLNRFETLLGGENFIRIHRSHIVNIDRIARVEPAGGGRMLVHMDNGEMITASRVGSKMLRGRVI